jgi:isoleucyl-tRNA synthetase
MSTVMENEPPFKRVLGYGTLLGEDGRPMHKSWGNAIEFNEGADKIGVDVMRWMYARQNPSENMLFGYKKADEVRRQFYLMLWNIYKFFVEYANLDKPKVISQKLKVSIKNLKLNILDQWILSRFAWLVDFVEKSLKNFDARGAALEIERFVSDLSTWYIRRSRDRVWVNSSNKEDKEAFYQTMDYILVNLSIILSPFIPFISEEMYTNLTGNQSVHLEMWPDVDKDFYNKKLEEEMDLARKIVEAGHAKRKEMKVKVRMPLLKLEVSLESDPKFLRNEVWQVVLDELNIKNIVVNGKFNYPEKEITVSQEQLTYEGELREFIRLVQSKRKEIGLKPTDYLSYEIPEKFSKDKDFLKRKLMLK